METYSEVTIYVRPPAAQSLKPLEFVLYQSGSCSAGTLSDKGDEHCSEQGQENMVGDEAS
jgi:hypothetical protein